MINRPGVKNCTTCQVVEFYGRMQLALPLWCCYPEETGCAGGKNFICVTNVTEAVFLYPWGIELRICGERAPSALFFCTMIPLVLFFPIVTLFI
jgi:hypothetical protein